MGGTAIEAEEDAVSGGCPCGAGVGAVEADGVGGEVFEFAELGVFVDGGDADLAAAGGGDGAVGSNVSGHGCLGVDFALLNDDRLWSAKNYYRRG